MANRDEAWAAYDALVCNGDFSDGSSDWGTRDRMRRVLEPGLRKGFDRLTYEVMMAADQLGQGHFDDKLNDVYVRLDAAFYEACAVMDDAPLPPSKSRELMTARQLANEVQHLRVAQVLYMEHRGEDDANDYGKRVATMAARVDDALYAFEQAHR